MKQAFIYWTRLLYTNGDLYAKKCFLALHDAERNVTCDKYNWCKQMRRIFEEAEHANIFNITNPLEFHQNCGSALIVLKEKFRLEDVSRVINSTKNRFRSMEFNDF